MLFQRIGRAGGIACEAEDAPIQSATAAFRRSVGRQLLQGQEAIAMIIYPDLELRQGRLVNLRRNRMDSPIIYDIDPVEAARGLASEGAQWLHVVDLDAVFNQGDNGDLIRTIIRKASCPVQVGGGIRSLDKVHGWMEAGAGRVVIATAAVKYPHLV
jgi:phosphoribosylformimino-5-aminoimidazole carboxamide ribotide isomerase